MRTLLKRELFKPLSGACGLLHSIRLRPPRAAATPQTSTVSYSSAAAANYDSFGSRIKSTATFYDAAGTLNTRASSSTYLTGKYPLTHIKRFIGDSIRDLTDTREYGDTGCRMPTKVTDAHGNFATMAIAMA